MSITFFIIFRYFFGYVTVKRNLFRRMEACGNAYSIPGDVYDKKALENDCDLGLIVGGSRPFCGIVDTVNGDSDPVDFSVMKFFEGKIVDRQ